MKKIIVPTDFSPAAVNAYAYARAFAEFTDRPLKVVHITHPGTYADTTLPMFLTDLKKAKEESLNDFVNKRGGEKEEGDLATLTIEQEVIIGFPGDELIKLSKEKDSDFIIMGTTGEKGAFNNLLGSISTIVSQKAHCPVWLIPPGVTYNGIDNILYAGNYESANTKMLDAIINVSDVFDSVIHLVHVHDPQKNSVDWRFEELVLEQLFKKKIPNFPIELHTVQNNSFWKGINSYAKDKNVDLIVMVTHHRDFWERLTHKSMTKTMLLHAEVPLLILHLEDAV